jgi:hypothetical protein
MNGGDREMTGDPSEEAAWRDLVAHYAAPAVAEGTPTPWPTREDLPAPRAPGQDAPSPEGSGPDGSSPEGSRPDGSSPEGSRPDGSSPEGNGPEGSGPDTADLDVTGLDMAGPDDSGTDLAPPPVPRWPSVPGPFGGMNPGPPQVRIVRPASPAPPPGGDDEHFVPPVPPPLPRLDSVTKGAWAALFGGPTYLLLAVMLGWQVPSWAAFTAVAAFVGGFATLVVRMGDRPPRDSGPDDGAVV